MQTLRAGCSKAEPKFSFRRRPPFLPGAQDGQNLISWRWSIPSPADPVWWRSMPAVLSYHGNRATLKKTHKHTLKQTRRQDRLQYTAPLSLARSVIIYWSRNKVYVSLSLQMFVYQLKILGQSADPKNSANLHLQADGSAVDMSLIYCAVRGVLFVCMWVCVEWNDTLCVCVCLCGFPVTWSGNRRSDQSSLSRQIQAGFR